MEDILTILGQFGAIGTAIGTILLVFLFWKTIKQLEETVKLSRIQSLYRFRPWVGPINSIQFMSTNPKGEDQYAISVKNYGEIPASNVIAKFSMKTELITKEMLKNQELFTSFNLGPLLPNMEKRYWFFIESGLIEKVRKGTGQVFIILQFTYEHHGGNSEYGSISHYDATTNSFIHNEMWID
ncbi:MAG: hypothetical protein D4R90_02590 [Nitrosopumilales archaeon]|nr:MAG: hypothetical protein D4R90_02590 [Nitrosopumilales archaeon]